MEKTKIFELYNYFISLHMRTKVIVLLILFGLVYKIAPKLTYYNILNIWLHEATTYQSELEIGAKIALLFWIAGMIMKLMFWRKLITVTYFLTLLIIPFLFYLRDILQFLLSLYMA